jgi:hypothetical protein
VQPQLVDRDGLLLLERVRPLSTVLVLPVLPLGSYALLEEVIVGLEGQFRDRGNVVLEFSLAPRSTKRPLAIHIHRHPRILQQS